MSANGTDGATRFVVTRSTVFHRAVVLAALITTVATFLLLDPEWTLLGRVLLAALGGAIGLLVSLLVVVWLVGAAIIPRLQTGSFWDREAHDFMLSVFGTRWDRGGTPPDV